MNREKELKNLGYNIKRLRLEKDFTQEEFAEMIGKTANYVSLIENAHKMANLQTLFDIAEIFDVSIKELFEPCEKVEGKIKKYKKVYH